MLPCSREARKSMPANYPFPFKCELNIPFRIVVYSHYCPLATRVTCVLLYKGRYRERAKYQSGCKVRNLLLWDKSTKYFEQRNLLLLLTTLNSPFNMSCMTDKNLLGTVGLPHKTLFFLIKRPKIEGNRNRGRSRIGRYLLIAYEGNCGVEQGHP